MASHTFVSNVWKKGKQVFQNAWKVKTQKGGIKIETAVRQVETVSIVICNRTKVTDDKLSFLWRRLFPQVYFRSQASQYGRRAAWQRASGVKLFTLVGIALANSSVEKDEVTDMIQNYVKQSDRTTPLLGQVEKLSLDMLELGQWIGQGCNAAVYEATLKTEEQEEVDAEDLEADVDLVSVTQSEEDQAIIEDSESDITVLSRDSADDHEPQTVLKPEMAVTEEDVDECDTESDISLLSFPASNSEMAPISFNVACELESLISLPSSDNEAQLRESLELSSLSLMESKLSESLLMRESSAPKSLLMRESSAPVVTMPSDSPEDIDTGQGECPDKFLSYTSLDSSFTTDCSDQLKLAVKMMFNYDVESNSEAILRAMDRETVPAQVRLFSVNETNGQNRHKVRKKALPPHPNIVEMLGVFVDDFQCLPDSVQNYPAALPSRIHANGIGRNKTMFIVMKRYQYNLWEYLSTFNPCMRERLILLAQLLEAVSHMRRHGIAHRDLKLDNLLLNTDTEYFPQLVVSDFGCCLADEYHGLQIPFRTEHTDRGGNSALMAPEISAAVPGLLSYLDFRKSDVWTAGALAYEILGAENPFYNMAGNLQSCSYSEQDLPPLPNEVPSVVADLVMSMLKRDPGKRPSAQQAADIIQTYLWSPRSWVTQYAEVPRSEVKWWLVTMATEVLLLKKSTESDLKRCFLQRVNVNNLMDILQKFGVTVA